MQIPPIDWDDLTALGVPPSTAFSSNGETVTATPAPSKLMARLLSLVASSPPPDRDADRMGYLRHLRDALILATDWTQMPDAPLTTEQRAAWTAYRQSLRNLPDAYSGSGPIPWPQEPS